MTAPARRQTALLAGFLLIPSADAAAEMGLIIAVDPAGTSEVNGGVFEGWGISYCRYANRVGRSDDLSRLAAEAFCDPKRGLELNTLRYIIGGGDPTHDHIARTDSMMPGVPGESGL